jgi:hypothetical protein
VVREPLVLSQIFISVPGREAGSAASMSVVLTEDKGFLQETAGAGCILFGNTATLNCQGACQARVYFVLNFLPEVLLIWMLLEISLACPLAHTSALDQDLPLTKISSTSVLKGRISFHKP